MIEVTFYPVFDLHVAYLYNCQWARPCGNGNNVYTVATWTNKSSLSEGKHFGFLFMICENPGNMFIDLTATAFVLFKLCKWYSTSESGLSWRWNKCTNITNLSTGNQIWSTEELPFQMGSVVLQADPILHKCLKLLNKVSFFPSSIITTHKDKKWNIFKKMISDRVYVAEAIYAHYWPTWHWIWNGIDTNW